MEAVARRSVKQVRLAIAATSYALLSATACSGSGSMSRAGHGHGSAGEHGHAGGGHAHPMGTPTGAECPPGQTLTYESFGSSFFASYCIRCHSEQVTGAARMAAPPDHNFDTLELIRRQAKAIDTSAGAGPAAQNRRMPPSGAAPGDAERTSLAEWLACGAP